MRFSLRLHRLDWALIKVKYRSEEDLALRQTILTDWKEMLLSMRKNTESKKKSKSILVPAASVVRRSTKRRSMQKGNALKAEKDITRNTKTGQDPKTGRRRSIKKEDTDTTLTVNDHIALTPFFIKIIESKAV
jgi:hypothetical protein